MNNANCAPRVGASIATALDWACQRLDAVAPQDQAPGDSRREALLLLAAVRACPTAALLAWPERVLEPEHCRRFADWIARRCHGEPIAYLLERRDFWSQSLRVTPATLIPRPETEALVEWALEVGAPDAPLVCADLGTGSGAIAIAIAAARPRWRVLALERSAAAIAVAAENARQYALTNLHLARMDWLSALAPACCDLIVANPPYIAEGDPHLALGDVRWEPRLALVAGHDGLAALEVIATTVPRCLKPGGGCALEHGWDQARAVRHRLAAAGLERVASRRDLAGNWRIATGWRARET